MRLTFKKFYVKAFIHQVCDKEDFQALFEIPEFGQLWSPSEVGAIFS